MFYRLVQRTGISGTALMAGFGQRQFGNNYTAIRYYFDLSSRNTRIPGSPAEAKLYRERAEKVKKTVYQLCWDNERQLFAENPDKKFYDETGKYAIAAEMFDRETQKALFDRCVADTTISRAYFFRFKHFEQMRKLGKGHN